MEIIHHADVYRLVLFFADPEDTRNMIQTCKHANLIVTSEFIRDYCTFLGLRYSYLSLKSLVLGYRHQYPILELEDGPFFFSMINGIREGRCSRKDGTKVGTGRDSEGTLIDLSGEELKFIHEKTDRLELRGEFRIFFMNKRSVTRSVFLGVREERAYDKYFSSKEKMDAETYQSIPKHSLHVNYSAVKYAIQNNLEEDIQRCNIGNSPILSTTLVIVAFRLGRMDVLEKFDFRDIYALYDKCLAASLHCILKRNNFEPMILCKKIDNGSQPFTFLKSLTEFLKVTTRYDVGFLLVEQGIITIHDLLFIITGENRPDLEEICLSKGAKFQGSVEAQLDTLMIKFNNLPQEMQEKLLVSFS